MFLSGRGEFYTLKSCLGMSHGLLKGRRQSLRAEQAKSHKKTAEFTLFYSSKLHLEENVFLLKNGEQLFWKC